MSSIITFLVNLGKAFVTLFVKVACWGTLAAIVIVSAVFLPPKFAHKRDLEALRNEAIRKVEHRRSEIETLKKLQQRLATDPEFAAFIARQYGYINNNEILFKEESRPKQ
ncbi:MAG: septum formation initiator family protein [Kiritimatiellaeota bacterium]|nr:septum formation initiator family protein [Kiritimatiellota bacterium]